MDYCPQKVRQYENALKIAQRTAIRYQGLAKKNGYDFFGLSYGIPVADFDHSKHLSAKFVNFLVEVVELDNDLFVNLLALYSSYEQPVFTPSEGTVMLIDANTRIKRGCGIRDYIREYVVTDYNLELEDDN
jgi:hypothetical protein